MLIILTSGFAPMISQTLAAKRLNSSHPPFLTQFIQPTPFCVFHAVTSGNDMDRVNVSASTDAASENHAIHNDRQMHGMKHTENEQRTHQNHPASHQSQEACEYCNLFAHSPFLMSTLPQLAAVAQVHHEFIATLGAAFRPYTVTAESRPQPPPLS